MTAEQIQKQRKKKQSVQEIFDWAREQFVKAEELYHRRKKDVILEVARRLEEAEFEQNKISSEIIHKLDGFVDPSYVNKVLTDFPQYKENYRVKNVEKRNFSRNIPTKLTQVEASDSTISAEPKYDTPQIDAISTEEQTGHKEVRGRFNITPEEYILEQLDEYDKALLIRIVRWLDEKNQKLAQIGFEASDEIVQLRKEVDAVKKKNASLKKENDEFRRLPNNDWLYNRIDVLQRENKLLKQQLGYHETKSPQQEKDWLLKK